MNKKKRNVSNELIYCVAIMSVNSLPSRLASFLVLTFCFQWISSAELQVENDDPAILGLPITFTAVYSGIGDYIFVFEDNSAPTYL